VTGVVPLFLVAPEVLCGKVTTHFLLLWEATDDGYTQMFCDEHESA
jgi:hypothetical protein